MATPWRHKWLPGWCIANTFHLSRLFGSLWATFLPQTTTDIGFHRYLCGCLCWTKSHVYLYLLTNTMENLPWLGGHWYACLFWQCQTLGFHYTMSTMLRTHLYTFFGHNTKNPSSARIRWLCYRYIQNMVQYIPRGQVRWIVKHFNDGWLHKYYYEKNCRKYYWLLQTEYIVPEYQGDVWRCSIAP